MKPTLEQVIAFAQSDLDAAKIPTPHEIALTLGAALLQSGKFGDDHGAAIVRAWTLVIDYYAGQRAYEHDVLQRAAIASGHQAATSSPASPIVSAASEPEMSAGEARSYVTGGETGGIGEVDPSQAAVIRAKLLTPAGPLPGSQTIDLEAVQARQLRISECTAKVIAAKAVLEEAEHHLTAAQQSKRGVRAAQLNVDRAKADFEAAAAEQSKAYE